MKRLLLFASVVGMVLLRATAQDAVARSNSAVGPGPRPDGSMLLPNQWTLRPVGTQIELGDFPVNIAVHPSSHFAAVLHCGYSQHELVVVDLFSKTVVSRRTVDEAFYGLAFSSDGKRLFCSGSSGELVYEFQFADGQLTSP